MPAEPSVPIVVDASALLPLCFDDELAQSVDALLDAIVARGACVPSIFRYEINNALLMAERRGRLDVARMGAFTAEVFRLPLQEDRAMDDGVALALARRHRLTYYDAAYLELALRRRLPLASLDEALLKAARGAQVVVWGSRTRSRRKS